MYYCAKHCEAYQRREPYTTANGLAKLNAMYILVTTDRDTAPWIPSQLRALSARFSDHLTVVPFWHRLLEQRLLPRLAGCRSFVGRRTTVSALALLLAPYNR
jgi:hypothetical protein